MSLLHKHGQATHFYGRRRIDVDGLRSPLGIVCYTGEL